LKIGDVVSVGEASFQIRSVVDAEPDKAPPAASALGPRVFWSTKQACARPG